MRLTLPTPMALGGSALVVPGLSIDTAPKRHPHGTATSEPFLTPHQDQLLSNPPPSTPRWGPLPSPTPATSDDGGGRLGCHVPSAVIDAAERQVPPGPRGVGSRPAQRRAAMVLRGGDGANAP